MKKFNCKFIGRKVGAIGKTYKNTITIKCNDITEVENIIYKDFENISNLKIK
jgi:hypothetical protein